MNLATPKIGGDESGGQDRRWRPAGARSAMTTGGGKIGGQGRW